MQSAKQKVSDAAAAAKEHLDILAAKTDEKVEKAAARSKEEKEIAEERRKAKEGEAKMNLHEAKARHAAEKLQAKQAHLYPQHHLHGGANPVVGGQVGHHQPVGTVAPTTGAVMPGYPLEGYPHGHGRHTRNI